MARLQGISGGLSGKTGSYTFRQSGGQTIVSQYQPIVKNPNTLGQQGQRAKFKLMSQLAAIMAPGFGTLGTIKRAGHAAPSQRNAFIKLNFPLVETTEAAESVVAKIPIEQLKLTSSSKPLGSLNVDRSGATAEVSIATASTDIKTVRMVLVGYPSYGGQSQPTISRIIDVPVESGEAAFTFDGLGAEDYTVLAFGLIPSESASINTRLDNIHTPADQDFIGALELNQLVSAGMMAETITMGANMVITG